MFEYVYIEHQENSVFACRKGENASMPTRVWKILGNGQRTQVIPFLMKDAARSKACSSPARPLGRGEPLGVNGGAKFDSLLIAIYCYRAGGNAGFSAME